MLVVRQGSTTGGKNLIGAFYQPRFVYIDVDTLKTLDKREMKAGLAEVIKYGVIRDPKLFKYLEDNVNILTKTQKSNLRTRLFCI